MITPLPWFPGRRARGAAIRDRYPYQVELNRRGIGSIDAGRVVAVVFHSDRERSRTFAARCAHTKFRETEMSGGRKPFGIAPVKGGSARGGRKRGATFSLRACGLRPIVAVALQ